MNSQQVLPHSEIAEPTLRPQSSRTERRIRIVIADEHPVVLQGLAAMLNSQPDMEVIPRGGNGIDVARHYSEHLPDIVIFDLQLQGISGIQTMLSIREKHPEARIIIFTACEGEEQVYSAISAGAQGYLLKSSSPEEIVACIHQVFQGQPWIPPAVGATLARRRAAPELTKREREVLHAMANGKSNKQIGKVLDISEGTVKVHVTHILEKLKVDGRTEALGVALSRGIVTLLPPPAHLPGAQSISNTARMLESLRQEKLAM